MRRRQAVRPGSSSGYALFMALLVIFLLSIALALVAASLEIRLRQVRREETTLTLLALSDAALAEAVSDVAYDPTFAGVPAHRFGGGTISSRAQSVTPDVFQVVAMASYAGRRRAVHALVQRTPGGARVTYWERAIGQ